MVAILIICVVVDGRIIKKQKAIAHRMCELHGHCHSEDAKAIWTLKVFQQDSLYSEEIVESIRDNTLYLRIEPRMKVKIGYERIPVYKCEICGEQYSAECEAETTWRHFPVRTK